MGRWEEGHRRQTTPGQGTCRALAIQRALLDGQESADAKLPTAFQLGQQPTPLFVKEQIIPSEVSGKGRETKGGRDWAEGQQPTLNPTARAAAGSPKGH